MTTAMDDARVRNDAPGPVCLQRAMSFPPESRLMADWGAVLAPVAAALLWLPASLPPWGRMWLLAGALFAGFKWATLQRYTRSHGRRSLREVLAYALLWPGMDARAFFAAGAASRSQACAMAGKYDNNPRLTAGVAALLTGALTFGLLRLLPASSPLAPWAGFSAMVLMLHFGLFELLAHTWRRAGRPVQPIMNSPHRARSLSDFWGERWNRAFRDVARPLLFVPLTRRFGLAAGTLTAFVFSGVVHELVISIPAGAGYGGPTVYFALQGGGLLFERSSAGRRLGLRRGGPLARVYAGTVVLAPVALLFHTPFMERVFVPFMYALGLMRGG